MSISARKFIIFFGFLFGAFVFTFQTSAVAKVGDSGLPLPRFVSIKSNEANVRAGPGLRYPIKWVMVRENLPLEIIAEFDQWRKVRDIQGDEGWMHKAMLSGRRTALVKGNLKNLFERADFDSEAVATMENGVIVEINSCGSTFCNAAVNDDVEGYIPKEDLWGVYNNEVFD